MYNRIHAYVLARTALVFSLPNNASVDEVKTPVGQKPKRSLTSSYPNGADAFEHTYTWHIAHAQWLQSSKHSRGLPMMTHAFGGNDSTNSRSVIGAH